MYEFIEWYAVTTSRERVRMCWGRRCAEPICSNCRKVIMSKVKKQKSLPIDLLTQKMTVLNEIPLNYGLSDCASLADIQDLIGKLIIQYGPSAKLILDAGHNNISESILVEKLETDDEYVQRLKSIKLQTENQIKFQTHVAHKANEQAKLMTDNLDALNDTYTKILNTLAEKK